MFAVKQCGIQGNGKIWHIYSLKSSTFKNVISDPAFYDPVLFLPEP